MICANIEVVFCTPFFESTPPVIKVRHAISVPTSERSVIDLHKYGFAQRTEPSFLRALGDTTSTFALTFHFA